MAFVMVLSWSHHIFLRFFLDATIENFIRGHIGAFETWGGLPKVMLYDYAKGDALERQGNTIRIHPAILEFSNHYHFEPRLAKGWEKSRVENTVRYIRESFFSSCSFIDHADINRQAESWCLGNADERPCHHGKTLTVREAFAKEKRCLLELPAHHYSMEDQ
jgi:transposase